MIRAKPVVLLILDGWGVSPSKEGNAIHAAKTPTWDRLMKEAPHIVLSGSGEDVGLPADQMGNSEVGHLTIGAGRVIDQDLSRITKSIKNGQFFENPVLKNAFHTLEKNQHSLHILGLLSPGGVHSHEDHLFAAIDMAKRCGVKTILLHLFLDGRDTPPQSAMASLTKLETFIRSQPNVHIATVSGRYFAMDRDKRWERVKLAYDAIVYGQGQVATSSTHALELAYERGETDEFVKPTCIPFNGQPFKMASNDSLLYMNFRSDRARALSYAFCSNDFSGFDRGEHPPKLNEIITLTEYDPSLPAKVVFPPQVHHNVLGEYLQNHHMTQLHLAETEKYAHVTFFFNGGIEEPYQGETRKLVASPKVATYDTHPEMSAFEVTDILIDSIKHQQYDFIVCNYANADMVGHTGNFEATVKAIETLDSCLAKVIDALDSVNGQALITSDHGNAECMLDTENHQPHTAHTTSLVPLVYVGKQPIAFNTQEGKLSDIAPTLLTLMGLPIPVEMTGVSLIMPIT